VRPAGDVDLLQRDLVPVQRPVLVAAAPFEAQRPAPAPHFADEAHRLVVGIRRHVAADVANREAAELVARVAVDGAGLRVHVEDGAAVVIVDEDRVLGRLEDGAVVRLRGSERLLVHAALELRSGAQRENLQHRLEQLLVHDRLAREHGDDADRLSRGILQRIAGVAHLAFGQVDILGVALGHPARHEVEAAVYHVAARRDRERVLDILAIALAAVDAERAHGRRRLVGDPPDEGEVHVEDGGEIARELLEHAVALRA
jgi:hypothetical protein